MIEERTNSSFYESLSGTDGLEEINGQLWWYSPIIHVRVAGESWYNTSWPYRKMITVNHSLVEEDLDALIGYLRLRDIRNSHRPELNKNPCMIIRELKVVGRELPIGEHENKALQHKGYGKELIEEAERICIEEYDKTNLFVLSGVGVKEYYRNLGFKDQGVYLRKTII